MVVPAGKALAGIDTDTELLEFAPEKVLETLLVVITEPIRLNESVILRMDCVNAKKGKSRMIVKFVLIC